MSIVVNYETIHQAAADCDATTKFLRDHFDQMQQELKPLIDSWEGDAQAAYVQLQNKWNQAFEDLAQLLAQIGAVLPQIGDGYQGTEKGVTSLMGG